MPAPRHAGALFAFENPGLNARQANVFWRLAVCPWVLPVTTCHQDLVTPLSLVGLACRVTVLVEDDKRYHVLFAQEGRSVQLEMQGEADFTSLHLMTTAIPRLAQSVTWLRSLKRLSDLAKYRTLRSSLYRPGPRGPRFIHVLQALDGWRAGATQREIAIALFGARRVDQNWADPRDHLRDRTRRAVRRGRALMAGGYLRLLR